MLFTFDLVCTPLGLSTGLAVSQYKSQSPHLFTFYLYLWKTAYIVPFKALSDACFFFINLLQMQSISEHITAVLTQE